MAVKTVDYLYQALAGIQNIQSIELKYFHALVSFSVSGFQMVAIKIKTAPNMARKPKLEKLKISATYFLLICRLVAALVSLVSLSKGLSPFSTVFFFFFFFSFLFFRLSDGFCFSGFPLAQCDLRDAVVVSAQHGRSWVQIPSGTQNFFLSFLSPHIILFSFVFVFVFLFSSWSLYLTNPLPALTGRKLEASAVQVIAYV